MTSRVRAYQNGDDEQLVALWSRAHADYGGYVPKTAEYWRWSVLQRPGMTPEDILVLEQQDSIVAYGVLGQKHGMEGQGGLVLELAVDPKLPARTRRKTASRLIAALENRSRARGDELLEAALPGSDEPVARAMASAGYKAEKSEAFQLVIVDLLTLLDKLLSHRLCESPAERTSTFALSIGPGLYRFCPCENVRVELTPHGATVEASLRPADYDIATDLSTITDIIFRRDTFESALMQGKIAFSPEAGLREVRDFFRLIRLRSNWYIPNVDGR